MKLSSRSLDRFSGRSWGLWRFRKKQRFQLRFLNLQYAWRFCMLQSNWHSSQLFRENPQSPIFWTRSEIKHSQLQRLIIEIDQKIDKWRYWLSTCKNIPLWTVTQQKLCKTQWHQTNQFLGNFSQANPKKLHAVP